MTQIQGTPSNSSHQQQAASAKAAQAGAEFAQVLNKTVRAEAVPETASTKKNTLSKDKEDKEKGEGRNEDEGVYESTTKIVKALKKLVDSERRNAGL